MRLIRIIVAIIGLLLIVGVVAISSLVLFIDPNKLKPIITTEVMKRTGYQLTIDGPLSWSFYPRPAIKIVHMTLSEPRQPAFIDLKDVQVATELWSWLRGLGQLRGDIRVATAVFMNLHFDNIQTHLQWENHVLTLAPLTASFYEGSLNGVVHGRPLAAVPYWDWTIDINRIQLKPLLQDASGGENKLKMAGIAHVKMQAATQGKTKQQMLSNLNGSSDFVLDNGIIEGIDFNYLVLTADALINKQAVPQPENINQTLFNSLTSTMTISSGKINTNNLLLVSPVLTIKGQGNFSLFTQTINLQLQVKSQQPLTTQWEIPVQIAGNVNHPDVRLDMTEIEKIVLREKINNVKTKVREEIKQHIPGKTGEFLQNLLGK